MTELKQLLYKYKNVFASSLEELGRTQLIKHSINTGNNPPVCLRPYRTSPRNRTEIDRQVNELLTHDLIQPSTSAYASPVVLVQKPDKSFRFCVDYRALNKQVAPDRFPLPLVSDVLDSLSGTAFFTTLDLRSGFWQIPLTEDARSKTAFITHSGLYEWKTLPFGLNNSSSTFQRLMTHLLTGIQYKYALTYIDDVLVYSKSFEDHLVHLEEVFKRFQEANLKLKPSKCYFAKTELDFLGHVVSRNGVRPNENKVKAVKDFPVPKNVKQVRSFLGLSGYYRKFVKDYAKIASPLFKLTKKSEKFVWTEPCQEAFDKLKRALVSSPVLAYPDFSKTFHVFTDASNDAIGMTLSQYHENRERVIAYAGRDLNSAEKNYSTTEKEALACVQAVKHFQPYLYGNHFVIHTDHKSLKWLMSLKDPTGRLARWSLLLQQYDFEIKHRAGKANANADALSRRHYGTCTLSALHKQQPVGGLQTEKLFELQRRDPELSEIITYLETEILPSSSNTARRILLLSEVFYIGEDGLLYHINTTRRQIHRMVGFVACPKSKGGGLSQFC